MKISKYILAWFAIILGILAILVSLDPMDGYALIGGALFLLIGLAYLEELKAHEI